MSKQNNDDIIELTEKNIQTMVYEIRNQKVLLDFDLAKIYGYETRRFNEQVKNNIEKFPEDFMFRLSRNELGDLVKCKNFTSRKANYEKGVNSLAESDNLVMSKKSTSRKDNFFIGQKGGTRKLPYAFTEQGVYMLMTVLRGGLATKQSIALIKLFKQMKDYISSDNVLLNNGTIQLVNLVNSNTRRIDTLESKINVVMDNFIDPSTYKHILIMNDQKLEADIAYQKIYSLAKKSIHIIDDYIDIKTFSLLKAAKDKVEIVVFSDNKAKNSLTWEFIDDFSNTCHNPLTIKKTNEICHDRFIVIDYKRKNEKVFVCGSSSKDSGKKVTTITKIDSTYLYHPLIELLMMNENLELP